MGDRGLIDLHCHVLPSLDDGPAQLDDALELARVAAADGTGTIVATPHVNHAYPDIDAARIAAAVFAFQFELDGAGIALDVLSGAEVSLTRAMDLEHEELCGLRLGGGPYLLVECPPTPTVAGFTSALSTLSARGHRILLAHAERIPAFVREPSALESLVAGGMLVQITASSVTGRYGRTAQEFSRQLMRSGLVHVVSSDAHHHEHRSPRIAAALTAAGWDGQIAHFARDVPQAILDGAAIPAAPAPPRARNRFRRRK